LSTLRKQEEAVNNDMSDDNVSNLITTAKQVATNLEERYGKQWVNPN